MQIIDLPTSARIVRVMESGQDPAPAPEDGTYVLLTSDQWDALVLRLLLAESTPVPE